MSGTEEFTPVAEEVEHEFDELDVDDARWSAS